MSNKPARLSTTNKNFYVEFIDDEVQDLLGELFRRSPELAKDIATQAALMIQDRAIKNINTGVRTGKEYTVTKAGKKHKASAPWEFPKSNTANLVKNITVSSPLNDAKGAVVDVGSREAAEYGYYLEFGTSKMAPRPWLGKSAWQEKDNINRFITDMTNRFLNEL